jgi:hypothetical protein
MKAFSEKESKTALWFGPADSRIRATPVCYLPFQIPDLFAGLRGDPPFGSQSASVCREANSESFRSSKSSPALAQALGKVSVVEQEEKTLADEESEVDAQLSSPSRYLAQIKPLSSSLSTYNLWITACARPLEFRGTVQLKGTTDWGEFINIIARICTDNRCMPRCTSGYMAAGRLNGRQESSIYIIPPYIYEHIEVSPIVYGGFASCSLI